jgi:hypothetical protein
MSWEPIDPATRDELINTNAKIAMKGPHKSIWAWAVMSVLLEEEAVEIGDSRIPGRYIKDVDEIVPKDATEEQERLFIDFAMAVRSEIFPLFYRPRAPPRHEAPLGDRQLGTIDYDQGWRKGHPNLQPDHLGPAFPVPAPEDEEDPDPKNRENFQRFRTTVQDMAISYMDTNPNPDGAPPDKALLPQIHNFLSGKTDRWEYSYDLFNALTFRNAICKLADRYVILVAAAPNFVPCIYWEPAAAYSLGASYSWYNSVWRKVYQMRLFPPPSPAGEQGYPWTKPGKFLAACLIFAGNDEEQINEKLDWLYAGEVILGERPFDISTILTLLLSLS